MSETQVSVIITCYNEGHFLPGAIRSVLEQTWANRIGQIVVVDDGSQEETRRIVAGLNSMDPRIQSILQENQGLPSARNRAIAEAEGEYIAILDADDLWVPEKLEIQLPRLDADPAIGLSYTDLYLVDVDDMSKRHLVRCQTLPTDHALALRQFFVDDAPIIPSCTILRRSVFAQTGLFDPAFLLGEDCEMWIRVLAKYACAHESVPTLLKRVRLNSLGSNELKRMPYNDRITEKTVRANPELRPLAGKRRARRLTKTGQYLEQCSRKEEARYYYVEAIKADIFFLRAAILWLLALLPTGVSLSVQKMCRRLRHG